MLRIIFRLFATGLGLCMVTAASAFPPIPSHLSARVANQMLRARACTLTRKSFVKDVVRQKGTYATYVSQFKEAKEIYKQLQNHSLETPFGHVQRAALSEQIDRLTLVQEQTRQLWKGILVHRHSSEAREDMAHYFEDYFCFGTENDVSLLPEDNLEESQLLQELQEIYRDFTERFTQFVQTHHRLPQALESIDADAEEMLLSQEYELFSFVNPYNRFGPLAKYIQQIEEAVKSVK